MRRTPGDGGAGQLYYSESLIAALRTWLGLKVRIRREEISISSPVWGFRPRRVALSFTTKFPKPAILILSPSSRVVFIISKTISTISADSFLENPVLRYTFSTRSALVIYSHLQFDIYPNFQVF